MKGTAIIDYFLNDMTYINVYLEYHRLSFTKLKSIRRDL